jgi:hypothetical protein
MAPRSASRDYDTVIADSPVRHALFNKPFSNFRRRTENLLDSITGGTLPAEVEADQRRERERIRALTCRYCKLTYANEDGLNKHYDLFPVHFTAEREKVVKPPRRNDRQPQSVSTDEQWQHQRSASQPITHAASPMESASYKHSPMQERAPLRQSPSPQSQSSPKAVQQMANPPKRKPSVPYEMHEQYTNEQARVSDDIHSSYLNRRSSSRARSTPNLKTSDEIPSSRPQPTVSYTAPDDGLQELAPAFHARLSVRPNESNYEMPSQLPYAQTHNAETTPIASTYAIDPRFASDFYLPPRSSPSGYDMAFDSSPSPYAVTNAMSFAHNTFAQQHSPYAAAAPPRAAAMLPNFDFEGNFSRIGRDGVSQPSSARPVHVPAHQVDSAYDRQAEINRQAGRRAAAQQQSRRSAAETAFEDGLAMHAAHPSLGRGKSRQTVGDAMRAIIATSATGSSGQAVMPASNEHSSAYMSLAGKDEDDVDTQTRSRKDSSSGRKWGTLMEAIPGSPQEDRTKRAAAPPKAIPPLKTGMTSFSDDAPTSPTAASSASNSPTRARRNTNPFHNRDFMRNIPTALKTPPLSPGSPWRSGSASPGNPFTHLSDEETDEASYFDAVEAAPRTPADEVRVVAPTRKGGGQTLRAAYETTMPGGGTVVF